MKKRRRLWWATSLTAITLAALWMVKSIQPSEANVSISFLGLTNTQGWASGDITVRYDYIKDRSKPPSSPIVRSNSPPFGIRPPTQVLLQISNGADVPILMNKLILMGRIHQTNGLQNPGSDIFSPRDVGPFGMLGPAETKTFELGLHPDGESWRAVLVYERWGATEETLTSWLPRLPRFAQSWLRDNTLSLRKAAVPFKTQKRSTDELSGD